VGKKLPRGFVLAAPLILARGAALNRGFSVHSLRREIT
jgi:hypothetical protein